GTASIEDLRRGIRRPGCTKRLSLIQPTEYGHIESPIVGRESEVARLLGVSSDIVRERIRVLTRRDTIGRTGVFIKMVVPEGASFEEVLKSEAESNPALRRTLREKQLGLNKQQRGHHSSDIPGRFLSRNGQEMLWLRQRSFFLELFPPLQKGQGPEQICKLKL